MDPGVGVLEHEPGPVISESGMFLISVDGPQSDEDFGAGFTQIQPALAEDHITTVLAHDGTNYAIYGFHKFDPRPIVIHLIETVNGWSTRSSAFLKGIGPIGIPLPVYDCEMPYNGHPLHPGDEFRTCTGARQHQIGANHNVAYCPVCGNGLQ